MIKMMSECSVRAYSSLKKFLLFSIPALLQVPKLMKHLITSHPCACLRCIQDDPCTLRVSFLLWDMCALPSLQKIQAFGRALQGHWNGTFPNPKGEQERGFRLYYISVFFLCIIIFNKMFKIKQTTKQHKHLFMQCGNKNWSFFLLFFRFKKD